MRGDPIWFRVKRLNHSATTTSCTGEKAQRCHAQWRHLSVVKLVVFRVTYYSGLISLIWKLMEINAIFHRRIQNSTEESAPTPGGGCANLFFGEKSFSKLHKNERNRTERRGAASLATTLDPTMYLGWMECLSSLWSSLSTIFCKTLFYWPINNPYPVPFVSFQMSRPFTNMGFFSSGYTPTTLSALPARSKNSWRVDRPNW